MRPVLFVSGSLFFLFASGCALIPESNEGDPGASARLLNASGQPIGRVNLVEDDDGVHIVIGATGLPAGEHGVHVHESGRCDPPSFESAGGHFNPTGRQHGSENPRGPHVGDLGNITVDSSGVAAAELLAERATLEGGRRSLLRQGGTALVIHAGPDDLKTDPAGNSGARIACGVITAD